MFGVKTQFHLIVCGLWFAHIHHTWVTRDELRGFHLIAVFLHLYVMQFCSDCLFLLPRKKKYKTRVPLLPLSINEHLLDCNNRKSNLKMTKQSWQHKYLLLSLYNNLPIRYRNCSGQFKTTHGIFYFNTTKQKRSKLHSEHLYHFLNNFLLNSTLPDMFCSFTSLGRPQRLLNNNYLPSFLNVSPGKVCLLQYYNNICISPLPKENALMTTE